MKSINITEVSRQSVEAMTVRPVLQHPRYVDIAERNIEWARSHCLLANDTEIKQARNIRVGSLAAYAFPNEPTEIVQIGADLILWLFLFDDAIGEASPEWMPKQHRRIIQSYIETMYRRELPEEPSSFHRALLDLLNRVVEMGATEDWYSRFVEDMEGYFVGCVNEVPYRRGMMVPSVGTYRDIRALTVGTSAVFAIIELGKTGIVPSKEMRRTDVVEARRIAALLTAWVNDVYSYPKESAAGDPLNLVAVLENQYGLEPKAALAQAADVYNKDLSELENIIVEAVTATCSESLHRYFDGLLDWVHGNRIWTKTCGRYY